MKLLAVGTKGIVRSIYADAMRITGWHYTITEVITEPNNAWDQENLPVYVCTVTREPGRGPALLRQELFPEELTSDPSYYTHNFSGTYAQGAAAPC